jgi:hypothetical protein
MIAVAPFRAAQPGVAVDRFARKILAFLNSYCAARSRQLNANPFGTRGNVIAIPFLDLVTADRAS